MTVNIEKTPGTPGDKSNTSFNEHLHTVPTHVKIISHLRKGQFQPVVR